jgi:hypothetical protein
VANLALRVSLTATRVQIVRLDTIIKDIVSNLSIVYNSSRRDKEGRYTKIPPASTWSAAKYYGIAY